MPPGNCPPYHFLSAIASTHPPTSTMSDSHPASVLNELMRVRRQGSSHASSMSSHASSCQPGRRPEGARVPPTSVFSTEMMDCIRGCTLAEENEQRMIEQELSKVEQASTNMVSKSVTPEQAAHEILLYHMGKNVSYLKALYCKNTSSSSRRWTAIRACMATLWMKHSNRRECDITFSASPKSAADPRGNPTRQQFMQVTLKKCKCYHKYSKRARGWRGCDHLAAHEQVFHSLQSAYRRKQF